MQQEHNLCIYDGDLEHFDDADPSGEAVPHATCDGSRCTEKTAGENKRNVIADALYRLRNK